MKSIFTTPKVVKYDDPKKHWYVYFRYDGKLFRYKFGINYIKDLKKREKEANILREALHQKLKDGWNPLVPQIEATRSDLSIVEALTFALDKKKDDLAKKTYADYKCSLNFIAAAVKDLHLESLNIQDTKRVHIKTIMEQAKKNRKWSNKAYNKHLNHFRAILSELIQWDIIENNPAYKINNLSVSESQANIPATPEQHKIIKECLESKHPDFYNFIITIFHTGIRPEEILQITIGMINLNKNEIILPPEITKTDKERIVPINNHLMEYYDSMDLDQYPNDFYLFGSFREPGKGNIGKQLDFIPGPTRIRRDTATNRWKRIVKDGLGIEVNMYSNKHAGANAKILAGMDLDALRELYGHTSKLMTLKYATVVKQVYRNQIMELSPAF